MSRIDLSAMNGPQRQAVVHGEGPLLLLAGPGSGKTFTITNRILYLLEQGVSPETILVITFTKEAALSMQNRFQKMSAAPQPSAAPVTASYPVNFGTFHSVFYHILKESNPLKSGNLLKNSEKKNLLLPILDTYEKREMQSAATHGGQGNQGDLGEDAVQILSAISYYKNTLNLSAAEGKAPARWRPYFGDICREYGLAVKRTGQLDFDDMLYECRNLLQENASAREYWQKRFRHILIDEFQDINPVQYEAVKLLAHAPYNIFAVGDDDQSIYGFRGSEPECMKRFKAEFHARELLLDVNYRSRAEIVRASLAVIGENKDRFVKELKAAPQASSDTAGGGRQDAVAVRAFKDKEEQYAYLLEGIPGCLKAGETCAVLFRTNAYMQGFAARLKAADVPYEMRERAASIYEHFIVADIMAYLQAAQGEKSRELLLRIVNKPSRYVSREAVWAGDADIRKMIAYYDRAQIPDRQKISAKSGLERLERHLESMKRLSLKLAVHYILKAVGYEQYLRELAGAHAEKWREWQEVLEWLKEDAGAHSDVREWQSFQENYTAEPSKPQGGKAAVQLLTAHGSKGLEFDRVWIPDCNERIFPHGKMPDTESVEEERRIFYVAMTRAKKCLELLYLTGTEERPRQPSRFLNPLFAGGGPKAAYSSSPASSSYSHSSRYSSKASATLSYSSSSSI